MEPKKLTNEEQIEVNNAVMQTLKTRQDNGIIFTTEQELEFLIGATTVMQAITGDMGQLSMKAFLCASGRPSTDFKYDVRIGTDANGKPKFYKQKS